MPERVAGLVVITPAYDPVGFEDESRLARYDALSDAMRRDGVEGYLAAFDVGRLPQAWRDSVAAFVGQSLARHAHLDAVADALRAVPRSRPFEDLHALEQIECPAVVVASRDEADPGHPLALAETYAELLPHGRLVVEEEGKSPLAWQGGRLSKLIAGLAQEALATASTFSATRRTRAGAEVVLAHHEVRDDRFLLVGMNRWAFASRMARRRLGDHAARSQHACLPPGLPLALVCPTSPVGVEPVDARQRNTVHHRPSRRCANRWRPLSPASSLIGQEDGESGKVVLKARNGGPGSRR